MAELADAPDLGSGGQPCGFESHYPYQTKRDVFRHVSFCLVSRLRRESIKFIGKGVPSLPKPNPCKFEASCKSRSFTWSMQTKSDRFRPVAFSFHQAVIAERFTAEQGSQPEISLP